MIFKHRIQRLKYHGRTFTAQEDIVKSFFRSIISCCKAKNRDKFRTKIDFNVDYLYQIYNAQKGRCIFSGIKMLAITRRTREVNQLSNVWNQCSIDRINSNQPYKKGNIQLVCNAINKMKNNLPNDEFIGVCNALSQKLVIKRPSYYKRLSLVKNIK